MSKYDSKIMSLRNSLGLNQDQFATILGVKKLTVDRYEREYDPHPTEMVKQKLLLIHNTMDNNGAREFIKDIFKSNQTSSAAAILSSILQLGAVIFSLQVIEMHNYNILDVVNNPIATSLMKHIKYIFDENKTVVTL